MKSKIALISLASLIGLSALFFWLGTGPSNSDPKFTTYDPGFDPYISAYTEGEISRKSAIQVHFATDMVAEEQLKQTLDTSPFSFQPHIQGETRWITPRVLEFTPASWLSSGQVYQTTLDMLAIKPEMPTELSSFHFQFATPRQSFKVELTANRTLGQGKQRYQQVSGVLRTVDVESPEHIEQLFQAQLKDKSVRVKWEHLEDHRHIFVIDSLDRGVENAQLNLRWDASDLGIESEGQTEVVIPSLNQFRHLHTYTYSSPEPHVVLEFSNPVKKNQDLSGLIRLGKYKLSYTIDANRIKVFPKGHLTGAQTIQVSTSIESEDGIFLQEEVHTPVLFSTTKPEVRLVGKGVIIPASETLPFVFETIGLKAVDVRILKINEQNVHQFLQVNQLNGSRELKRVGVLLAQEKISLDNNPDLNLNEWNRHSLDLSKLIKAEPGAIYEVAIGFRKSYTYYTCSDADAAEEAEKNMLALDKNWNTPTYSDSYWDEYEGDYYYNDYDYEDRDDPCKRPFYHRRRIQKRNVIGSNLGLIAKQGSGGSLFIVTDLKTTQPVANAKLELYNYQHQLIHQATTDSKGMVEALLDQAPFLLVAKHGGQFGYLRLDDGSAISMSRFDTQGQRYYKGVKGFLYGERGVWRPGDPIYLNFILEDKENSLPVDHPVLMELIDPRGQRVQKIARTQGMEGFYAFHTQTKADAPTGNYLARVRVGGATFTKTIKVETIMPNRLKIKFEFERDYLSALDPNASGSLNARWLHGAIAKNLKATIQVNLNDMKTQFKGYEAYAFDDPARKFSSEEVTLFEGELDETGTVKVPAKIKTESDAPGKLQANFRVKVFEPGGAFSVDRFSIPYSPFSTYVGIKAPKGDRRGQLLTDQDHSIDLVTVNADGQPVSSTVDIKVYKLRWKWWWDRSNESLLNYRGRVNAEEVSSGKVTTSNGKGAYTLRINKPEWGRFLVRATDKNGHTTGKIVYVDWPGWAGRAADDERGGAQMLSFSANKETFRVGEQVTLNIPTGQSGRALVSIENGTKVVKAYWVNATEGTTQFSFPTNAEMTPNAYVNVSLLQPHAQTQNDLPIRMYGVIPIKVEDPSTHLKPVITMASQLEPNSQVAIKVSEQQGKPMTYTVAMVDEGLLDLTRFQTPEPWKTFYKRIALDVKTWDLYDHVVGAFGGEIKSLLSIGGGAGEETQSPKKQDRFRPVVKFLGPFTLEPGQSKTHTLEMPNYIGSVRTMVVAADVKKGAYGSVEKTTPVKKPLMVLGTLPRVLGPGETVGLPVTVFAMEDYLKQVEVSVKTGRRSLVNGSAKQTLEFSSPGEDMAIFEIGVLNSLGKEHITITARSGSEVAVYETDIEVRAPNPRVTTVYATQLETKGNWKQAYEPVGMRGTNNGVLEVSAVPPLNLGKRLRYLLRYPYGCIEQTTSSVFPQVYLSSLQDLNDKQKEKIDKNIKAGIDRLRHFQVSSGGMVYWPGSYSGISNWGTNYAGHFFLEAQRAGYHVPAEILENWKSYQQTAAQGWEERTDYYRYSSQLTQAYRLYLLALAGSPEMGSMNRLRKGKNLYNVAAFYLAGAYHLAGQKDVARRMAKDLSIEVREYKELGYTYGSTLRDKAIMLQIMSAMEDRERATLLAQEISDALSNQNWYSTQTTAYSLVGMAHFIGAKGQSPELKFEYRLKGGSWTVVEASAAIWESELAEVQAGEVEIRNRSGSMIFPRLVLDGIPREGNATDESNQLAMEVSYQDLNGNSIDPATLEQGSDFVVAVSITNPSGRDYEEMAIDQIFPSGWEIHNSRMDGSDAGGDRPEYRDVRDDRVYTFFDLPKGKSKTFKTMLNASYLGRYYLPTVSCEAMYDRSIYARRKGQWVKVVSPGQGG